MGAEDGTKDGVGRAGVGEDAEVVLSIQLKTMIAIYCDCSMYLPKGYITKSHFGVLIIAVKKVIRKLSWILRGRMGFLETTLSWFYLSGLLEFSVSFILMTSIIIGPSLIWDVNLLSSACPVNLL